MARLLLTAAWLLALLGCARGDPLADLRAFLRELEARPGAGAPPLPDFAAPAPFIYRAGDRRSPFEPPALAPGAVQPAAGARRRLEGFPLAALTMVGSLRQGDAVYGLVEDAEGSVHRVAVGDYLGSQWAQVERIEEGGMELAELLPDGRGGWAPSRSRLELRVAP